MKHTILLIEDNEQNLYLATFLLEKNGFEGYPGPQRAGRDRTGRPDPARLDHSRHPVARNGWLRCRASS